MNVLLFDRESQCTALVRNLAREAARTPERVGVGGTRAPDNVGELFGGLLKLGDDVLVIRKGTHFQGYFIV